MTILNRKGHCRALHIVEFRLKVKFEVATVQNLVKLHLFLAPHGVN